MIIMKRYILALIIAFSILFLIGCNDSTTKYTGITLSTANPLESKSTNAKETSTKNESTKSTSTNKTSRQSSYSKVTTCEDISQADLVRLLFYLYGSYESDGCYWFRDSNYIDSLYITYSFVYSPSFNMYNASVLITSNLNVRTFTYASITFSWGGFEHASYYAYRELDGIAKIEFSYDVLTFDKEMDTIGNDYTYKIRSNTFKYLTEKKDIDDYASYCYEPLKQVITYIHYVLYRYELYIKILSSN